MNTFNINGSVVELNLATSFQILSNTFTVDYRNFSAELSESVDFPTSFSVRNNLPQYNLFPVRTADSSQLLNLVDYGFNIRNSILYKYRPVFLAPGSASLIKLAPLPTLQIEYPRSGQIFPLGDGTESIEIRTQVG